MLSSRVIGELEVRPYRINNTCIIRTNKLRHLINRLQIEPPARARRQNICIFPAAILSNVSINGEVVPDPDGILPIVASLSDYFFLS